MISDLCSNNNMRFNSKKKLWKQCQKYRKIITKFSRNKTYLNILNDLESNIREFPFLALFYDRIFKMK